MNINQSGLATLVADHGPIWCFDRTRFGAFTHQVADGLQQPQAAGPSRRPGRLGKQIGVLPLTGVLFEDDLELFVRRLDELGANSAIGQIVLRVASPGGTAAGTPEAAAAVKRVKAIKPVHAHATFAASAAYWIASQATTLGVTPSGEVGSIGVWSMHIDESKMLEDVGLDVTLISAGEFKIEGNPFGPLGRAARAEMQSNVDRLHNDFLRDVSRGRAVSVSHVRTRFGRGRMVDSKRALVAGMVDEVGTFEQFLGTISSPVSAARRPRATIMSSRSRSLAMAIAIEEEAGRN